MAKTRTKGITVSVAGNIGQLVSVNGLGITAETQDVTELGDAVRQFIATIAERGEMTLGVLWDPDAHDAVEDLVVDQLDEEDPSAVVVAFPEPADKTYNLDAWVTGFNFQSLEPGGVVKADIVLKVTGE